MTFRITERIIMKNVPNDKEEIIISERQGDSEEEVRRLLETASAITIKIMGPIAALTGLTAEIISIEKVDDTQEWSTEEDGSTILY